MNPALPGPIGFLRRCDASVESNWHGADTVKVTLEDKIAADGGKATDKRFLEVDSVELDIIVTPVNDIPRLSFVNGVAIL